MPRKVPVAGVVNVRRSIPMRREGGVDNRRRVGDGGRGVIKFVIFVASEGVSYLINCLRHSRSSRHLISICWVSPDPAVIGEVLARHELVEIKAVLVYRPKASGEYSCHQGNGNLV